LKKVIIEKFLEMTLSNILNVSNPISRMIVDTFVSLIIVFFS